MKLKYLTDKEIEDGILKLECDLGKSYPDGITTALHEHPDCIRLAYAWLDAQPKTTGICRLTPLKHIIEKWAKRYVSSSDVVVAASIHPEIRGTYPRYNISSSFVYPSCFRKEGIEEAGTQNYGKDNNLWNIRGNHKRIETLEDGEFTIYRLPYGGRRTRSKDLIERNARINAREFGEMK